MIKKILIEENDAKILETLSIRVQSKYIDILNKYDNCPEEYIIGVDIATPGSKDMSAIIHWRNCEDGTINIEGIEYF